MTLQQVFPAPAAKMPTETNFTCAARSMRTALDAHREFDSTQAVESRIAFECAVILAGLACRRPLRPPEALGGLRRPLRCRRAFGRLRAFSAGR